MVDLISYREVAVQVKTLSDTVESMYILSDQDIFKCIYAYSQAIP